MGGVRTTTLSVRRFGRGSVHPAKVKRSRRSSVTSLATSSSSTTTVPVGSRSTRSVQRMRSEARSTPPPRLKPLPGQSPVQVAGTEWLIRSIGCGRCIPVLQIGLASAEAARTVSRSQCDRIVEEEERCPRAGPLQWMPPSLVLEETGDPQRATMMTGKTTPVVDQTATVAGEQPTLGGGMEIAPRVDPVTSGHQSGGEIQSRSSRRLADGCMPPSSRPA